MAVGEVGWRIAVTTLWVAGCQFGSPGGGGSGATEGDEGATGATAGSESDTVVTSGSGSASASASGTMGMDDADATSASATQGSTGGPDSKGDGSSTGPAASCGDDNGGCDPIATCDDTSGQIVCACPPGYAIRSMGCVVDATLETLRWDLECTGGGGCSGDYCPAPNEAADQAVLMGDPSVIFEVTLSFLGVVEQKQIDGGTADGMWNEGGTPIVDDWNTATLTVSDPDQLYYLNDGAAAVTYTSLVTYQRTIAVRGGATVTLATQDTNACMVWNHSPTGDPIVVPGVPPFPMAHPGQFIQADVVKIAPLR